MGLAFDDLMRESSVRFARCDWLYKRGTSCPDKDEEGFWFARYKAAVCGAQSVTEVFREAVQKREEELGITPAEGELASTISKLKCIDVALQSTPMSKPERKALILKGVEIERRAEELLAEKMRAGSAKQDRKEFLAKRRTKSNNTKKPRSILPCHPLKKERRET
jgi:hypothetical protein